MRRAPELLGRAAALGLVLLASCAAPAPRAIRAPTFAEWKRARLELASLRAKATGAEGEGAAPARTLRLSLALREPYTGKVLQARGAVAVAPPHSLRMILLGPGGTTALDLWAVDDRFRFVVPAIDLTRRGDATTPRASMRGLPVDFLRFWMLRPFSGTLLWHERAGSSDRFVLRDEGAVVEAIAHDDGRVSVRRSTFAATEPGGRLRLLDTETVTADGLGCSKARYHQGSTGLDIAITCEGVETARAPNPRAFVDPDAAAGDEP